MLAEPEREVLLQIDHLVKEFPVTSGAVIQRKLGTVKAVSDVSFSVHRGETFGLVGESGCGKTTIGWLIVALHRATAGSIRFEGDEVTTLRRSALQRRRRDLQLMFQDPYASLDPRMRVGPSSASRSSSRASRPGPSSAPASASCSRRSASRPARPSSTRTSSREASGSASGSPGRSPSTRS